MSKVRNKQLIALRLCHDVEEDALSVGLVVAADVYVQPFAASAHVLTCVRQRIEHPFPCDDPGEADLGKAGRGYAICDPGGLFQLAGYEQLNVIVEGLMEGRRPDERVLGEIDDSGED